MPRRMLRYYNDIKTKFPKYEILQYLIYIGKEKLKEVEKMLREIKFEDLPSYEIGFEKGKWKSKLEDAIIMIEKFNLKVQDVSKELKIPIEEIEKRLSKK